MQYINICILCECDTSVHIDIYERMKNETISLVPNSFVVTGPRQGLVEVETEEHWSDFSSFSYFHVSWIIILVPCVCKYCNRCVFVEV